MTAPPSAWTPATTSIVTFSERRSSLPIRRCSQTGASVAILRFAPVAGRRYLCMDTADGDQRSSVHDGFKWAGGNIGRRHKLGGLPDWVQRPDVPECPSCYESKSVLQSG